MQIKKFRSPLSVRLRGERKAHGTTLLAEPLHPITRGFGEGVSAAWGLITQTKRYSFSTFLKALGRTARETGSRSLRSADAFSRVIRSLAGPYLWKQHFSVEADNIVKFELHGLFYTVITGLSTPFSQPFTENRSGCAADEKGENGVQHLSAGSEIFFVMRS